MKNLFELPLNLPRTERIELIKRYLKNKFAEPEFKKDKQVYTLPITIKEFKQKQNSLKQKRRW